MKGEEQKMRTGYKTSIALAIGTLLLGAFQSIQITNAQGPIELKCDSSIDNLEFTKAGDVQKFTIALPARAILSVAGSTAGETLTMQISVLDPIGGRIAEWSQPGNTTSLQTPVLAARGNYVIETYNYQSIGLYSLKVTCSGITPKTAATSTPQSTSAKWVTQPTVAPQITPASAPLVGRGFPGLPPVSFQEVETTTIELGKPEQAVINTKSNDIYGFTFDAKANDVLDLSFLRKSGNLNLGLVVLSSESKVVFQTSLVTSSSLNTRLALPSAGQYTIGVFKIDLLQAKPATVTKFEITAKLNP